MMITFKEVNTLIIGTGISGLFNALKLSEAGIPTLLMTKSTLSENNSSYAQGGIAAVLPQNIEDSIETHLQDTLKAGAGLCDESVTRFILDRGFTAIGDLLRFGVPFDREKSGKLALTLEAGHSIRRIIHAGGDATGKTVEDTLIRSVHANPLIEVIEHCQVIELLKAGERCIGCRAVSYANTAGEALKEYIVYAGNTVLATGGIGRLYSHTTNPPSATGDGLVLAYEAGAALKDIEFIQFHPTAFYADGQVRFLISEALRGEGGILRDPSGVPFAQKYHPHGELAPRDIVTRAIYSELQTQGIPNVFLDITHLPVSKIEARFPTILDNCMRFGVDIRREQIPVAPAAHYIMGGIAVDLSARSSVDNLYVVGESAYTGLHGANRLASNSLLECLVLSQQAAAHIMLHQEETPRLKEPAPSERKEHTAVTYGTQSPKLAKRLKMLHQLMWSHAGIVRNGIHIHEALEKVSKLEAEADEYQWGYQVPEGVEYANQLVLARLILDAALARQESRGAHYRSDYPELSASARHSIIRLAYPFQFESNMAGISS